MRLIHYLEVENFKGFSERQRIELDHPTVLIGPNNCGKTTSIQAIALWSQAVKSWFDAKGKKPPKERRSTSLNRLSIVSVPVQKTRYFWHNTSVRKANKEIELIITLGVLFDNEVKPVSMKFRNQGDELVYCRPDERTVENLDLIEAAASLNIELLYPMSGLETEEPILQPGRIDVLLGQGQTAQVLRNLCLMVYRESSDNWLKVRGLVKRLFSVDLSDPKETSRGTIELHYRQDQVKDELDIALAGRGFQQTLLIFSYLYSHPKSVLLIDEPDAHLEILRQKQIYALLRDIAAENESQVILVTHSEVVLNEALDTNLTLLIGSQADDLASKSQIKDSLKHYGAEHYVRAKQAGYVLYLEGSTDLSMLKELAKKIQHPVLDNWSDRANVYYVQDNYPDEGGVDAALDRVEGGFGITPREHFGAARGLVEGLKGLAILDSDGRAADSEDDGQLRTVYWKRYELENYFISPGVLRRACIEHYGGNFPLFGDFQESIENVLNDVTREYIFDSDAESFETWRKMNDREAKVLWLAQSRAKKLSAYAEEFFRRLATELGHAMLYRKSNLFELIRFIDSDDIDKEIIEKLNALQELFQISRTDVK